MTAFRIIAEREADSVRLITRSGHDFSERFPLIVGALAALPARSCVVDGEAIACDAKGLSVFERIRWRQHDAAVSLCAFDLLALMAKICGASRSRFVKPPSKAYCAALDRVPRSTDISQSMARSSTSRHARPVAKA
jgi:ATP dependent DNA ligase domain